MQPKPHPAMSALERFLGEWELTATFAGGAMRGVVSTFEWLEGGTLLVERTVVVAADDMPVELLASSPLPTSRVIGYDDTSETYTVLYVDARAVARVYQMRLSADRWEMWRDAPGFGQRYIGDFDADGRTISGRWEITHDNQRWEHDFDLTYTKVS